MIDLFLNIFGLLILTVSSIYVWSNLLDKKVDYSNYKFYILTVILFVITFLNYNSILKFTMMTIVVGLFAKFVFKIPFKYGLVTVLFTQTIGIVIELILGLIFIFALKVDVSTGNVNYVITFFSDLFVSISYLLIFRLKFIKKLHKNLLKIVDKISDKNFLLLILPMIFIFNAYIDITFYKISSLYVFLLSYLAIYVIIIIIIILAKKEDDYNKIYNKYNTTLNSLKEYEDILDKYRILNHENKNQLMTIRGLISSQNKKAINYIDEIVNNKIKNDEKVMKEVSIIPAGGLRGLIYSKLLYMKEHNIKYNLNISKTIRTVDLINNMENSDILDVCQIIGVYLDNAIDAVLKIEKKCINMDLYLENNNLVFEISNYYEGKIEINKIDTKGYSTKGNGHGYGLPLSNTIINRNKKLANEKKLSNTIFTQILKVKM